MFYNSSLLSQVSAFEQLFWFHVALVSRLIAHDTKCGRTIERRLHNILKTIQVNSFRNLSWLKRGGGVRRHHQSVGPTQSSLWEDERLFNVPEHSDKTCVVCLGAAWQLLTCFCLQHDEVNRVNHDNQV